MDKALEQVLSHVETQFPETVSDEGEKIIIWLEEQHRRSLDAMDDFRRQASSGCPVRLGKMGDPRLDGLLIEHGTELHKGVCLGLTIAKMFVGQFPVVLPDTDLDKPEGEEQ